MRVPFGDAKHRPLTIVNSVSRVCTLQREGPRREAGQADECPKPALARPARVAPVYRASPVNDEIRVLRTALRTARPLGHAMTVVAAPYCPAQVSCDGVKQ
jgi:hypothetical protein